MSFSKYLVVILLSLIMNSAFAQFTPQSVPPKGPLFASSPVSCENKWYLFGYCGGKNGEGLYKGLFCNIENSKTCEECFGDRKPETIRCRDIMKGSNGVPADLKPQAPAAGSNI